MPLYLPSDIDDIVAPFRQHLDVLSEALDVPLDLSGSDGRGAGALRDDLNELMAVANGAYDRTDDNVRRVEQALDRVMALLRPPVLPTHPGLPDAFWNTSLGVLVSRARWWVSVDDLITISNAAALAFGDNTQANRMRIMRAVERGELTCVPDPSVANPQHNKRVLRPQVERALRRPVAFRA